MAQQLYKYGEYKRKFAPVNNENALHSAAVAAALAANIATGTPAAAQDTGGVTASREEIEMALQSLEHGKMFKQRYDGDVENITGIGKFNYPIYKNGSKELEEYTKALQNAREKRLKLFTANGLWYANPEVADHDSEDAAAPVDAIEPNEVTLNATGPDAGVPQHLQTRATTSATQSSGSVRTSAHALAPPLPPPHFNPQDLSSFLQQSREIWRLRAKGGKMTINVNGHPVTYRNQDSFVRTHAAAQYKNFVRSRNIKQDVPDNLIDDAIRNAMARGL